MFNKVLLLVVVGLFITNVFADELKDDCEAAVDAADRLNADNDKHCDYSKIGLNGILHKAFSKNDSSASSAKDQPRSEVVVSKNSPARVAFREFDSLQQLMSVRYELLSLAEHECNKGFLIEREHSTTVDKKRLKLELYYNCIE